MRTRFRLLTCASLLMTTRIQQAGIKEGMRLVLIDGECMAGRPHDDVVALLVERWKSGNSVTLGLAADAKSDGAGAAQEIRGFGRCCAAWAVRLTSSICAIINIERTAACTTGCKVITTR